MASSLQNMTVSDGAELTLNLVSNASMETCPETKLSCFTTLLPTPLTGDWQVASLEIYWPALVRKITAGQITVPKSVARPRSTPPHQSPSKIISNRRPGFVSMRIPRESREIKPALTFTAPEVNFFKPGCYSSVVDIIKAIVKSATKNKELPPTTENPTDESWRWTNFFVESWYGVVPDSSAFHFLSSDISFEENVLEPHWLLQVQHKQRKSTFAFSPNWRNQLLVPQRHPNLKWCVNFAEQNVFLEVCFNYRLEAVSEKERYWCFVFHSGPTEREWIIFEKFLIRRNQGFCFQLNAAGQFCVSFFIPTFAHGHSWEFSIW